VLKVGQSMGDYYNYDQNAMMADAMPYPG
jgi:hypothetical protein